MLNNTTKPFIRESSIKKTNDGDASSEALRLYADWLNVHWPEHCEDALKQVVESESGQAASAESQVYDWAKAFLARTFPEKSVGDLLCSDVLPVMVPVMTSNIIRFASNNVFLFAVLSKVTDDQGFSAGTIYEFVLYAFALVPPAGAFFGDYGHAIRAPRAAHNLYADLLLYLSILVAGWVLSGATFPLLQFATHDPEVRSLTRFVMLAAYWRLAPVVFNMEFWGLRNVVIASIRGDMSSRVKNWLLVIAEIARGGTMAAHSYLVLAHQGTNRDALSALINSRIAGAWVYVACVFGPYLYYVYRKNKLTFEREEEDGQKVYSYIPRSDDWQLIKALYRKNRNKGVSSSLSFSGDTIFGNAVWIFLLVHYLTTTELSALGGFLPTNLFLLLAVGSPAMITGNVVGTQYARQGNVRNLMKLMGTQVFIATAVSMVLGGFVLGFAPEFARFMGVENEDGSANQYLASRENWVYSLVGASAMGFSNGIEGVMRGIGHVANKFNSRIGLTVQFAGINVGSYVLFLAVSAIVLNETSPTLQNVLRVFFGSQLLNIAVTSLNVPYRLFNCPGGRRDIQAALDDSLQRQISSIQKPSSPGAVSVVWMDNASQDGSFRSDNGIEDVPL